MVVWRRDGVVWRMRSREDGGVVCGGGGSVEEGVVWRRG